MSSGPRTNSQPGSASSQPTTDELLAMAYADGELSPEAVRVFEARLAHEARLRVLVADQQRIAILAREAAPSEPLELATLIVERGTPHLFLASFGRALLGLAIAWVAVWMCLACFDGTWRPPIAGAALAATLGLGFLALRAWLVRRATHHLDPYRDVRR